MKPNERLPTRALEAGTDRRTSTSVRGRGLAERRLERTTLATVNAPFAVGVSIGTTRRWPPLATGTATTVTHSWGEVTPLWLPVALSALRLFRCFPSVFDAFVDNFCTIICDVICCCRWCHLFVRSVRFCTGFQPSNYSVFTRRRS